MPLKKKGIHWYLTDEEVKFVRDQLNTERAQGIYEPGKWFVSGLNRKPEVLGATLPDRMPKKVVLRDITLRSAEQTPGVNLNPAERLRLLRALLEIGVRSFQLSIVGRSSPAPEQLREEMFYGSASPPRRRGRRAPPFRMRISPAQRSYLSFF